MVQIRKRKLGKKEYYYLEHSIRRGKKVTKKEKYLGEKVPEDIEKIKINFIEGLQSDLYLKLKQIKINFHKEWGKIPQSIKEKELEEIAIVFTYNTNAIEGSTITLKETREIIKDKIAPNKPLKDIKETEAHSKVFLQLLRKKEIITNNLLLQWHKKIFGETKEDIAGKYRDYLVRIGDYLAPDWQEVKNLMNKLIKYVNKSNENPVELAARAHYRFEKIHPFGDGNGRIGRLLMNHILWHNKYPMLIIEYKKRSSYYKSLTKSEGEFVKYFIRKYLKVHKKISDLK